MNSLRPPCVNLRRAGGALRADVRLRALRLEPGTQPAFIHCASGNRAAAMWLIKRVLVDKWDNDRALEEASQLGTMSPVMKAFALDYIQAHKK